MPAVFLLILILSSNDSRRDCRRTAFRQKALSAAHHLMQNHRQLECNLWPFASRPASPPQASRLQGRALDRSRQHHVGRLVELDTHPMVADLGDAPVSRSHQTATSSASGRNGRPPSGTNETATVRRWPPKMLALPEPRPRARSSGCALAHRDWPTRQDASRSS